MKKAVQYIILFLFVLAVFTGCSGKPYSFKESRNEIENIEIVTAESSLKFSVIKTISESEKNDFLKQFEAIKFRSYYVGDPMSVNGNAVKITYQNGDYEMICHYWSEYIKNGEVYPVRKNCDEKDFNKLLNNFLDKDKNTEKQGI